MRYSSRRSRELARKSMGTDVHDVTARLLEALAELNRKEAG